MTAAQLLEEVVVTAQKREESLQDVGISVTAFTGDQLQQLGFTNSRDITALAPGVANSGSAAGQNSQFTIRGVTQNDFLDVIEGPTAIYLDEGLVIQQNGGTFGLFDIERVEILKGPQGTLFGRNATGGLAHFVTRKPTDTYEAYADVTYARFNEVVVQSAVSGPLTDRLKARGAIYYRRHDEIYNNLYNEQRGPAEIRTEADLGIPGFTNNTPVPGGGQDHWNDNTIAGRFSLIFDINDDMELYLMGHGSRINQGEAPYQSRPSVAVYDRDPAAGGQVVESFFAGPNETREAVTLGGLAVNEPFSIDPDAVRPCPGCDNFGYRDADGPDFDLSKEFAFDDNMIAKMYGGNGRFTWDIDDSTTLVVISDYKEFDRNVTVDVDAAPVDQLNFNSQSETTSFTQEVRLNGATDRMRWVTGFYFLYADAEATNGLIVSPSSVVRPALGGLNADFANTVELETLSYSVFGQVDFDLTGELTAVAGLRLIQEEKDYTWNQEVYSNGNDPRRLDTDTLLASFPESADDTDPAAAYTEETSDTLWSAKLGLNWTPTDDLLVYGSASRGVKAGSFNAPLPLFITIPTEDDIGYDEEVLWAYEVGFKSTLFDGLARFNGSFYYYDYQDYQAFQFIGVSGFVSNADAEMYGVEAELFASPIEGLDFFFGMHASDPIVKDITIGGVTKDRRPSFAPRLQASGLVRYSWPAFGGTMAAQADASFKSFMYNNLTNFAATKNAARTTGNLRLSYETNDGSWRVTAFVENVADARNENLGFDVTTACGCTEVVYERPRWYGINVRYAYGQ